MINLSYLYIFLILLVIAVSCNDYPRDTKNSFEEAKAKGLKVGMVENPPFIEFQNNSISGIEIRIIEEFAEKHNLNIRYIRGTETELINQLENYELHILAGGFDRKTVWSAKAGRTASYDQKHVLLIPKGENRLLHKLEQHIFEMS